MLRNKARFQSATDFHHGRSDHSVCDCGSISIGRDFVLALALTIEFFPFLPEKKSIASNLAYRRILESFIFTQSDRRTLSHWPERDSTEVHYLLIVAA